MMGQLLWLTTPLIALTMVVYMAPWFMTKITQIIAATKKISPGGVALSEAKTVLSHYHQHLSENGLIKSMPELSASPFSVKRELSYHPTNGGSKTVSQSTKAVSQSS